MWVLDDDLGRGERIRTSGLYVPNVALYQAKLHPEVEPKIVAKLKIRASSKCAALSGVFFQVMRRSHCRSDQHPAGHGLCQWLAQKTTINSSLA